jgi:hypothetical protein
MANRVVIIFLIDFLALTSASVWAEESSIRLEKISIHLFLENSGVLSDDITSISGFSAWNFRPSGLSFSDDDRFHSFLIKVWFFSEREHFQAGEQARVLLRSEKTGKVLFESTIKELYIGKDGRTVKPFLISGYVCEPLVVEVRGRPKTITKILPFKCSE